MPAVSKKQQRFFGIVRAIQKGEMAPTTPETAKAAADMKKSDVKDFASTKHKKLPEKKVAKEAADFSQRDKIMKKAKPLHKHLYSRLLKKMFVKWFCLLHNFIFLCKSFFFFRNLLIR